MNTYFAGANEFEIERLVINNRDFGPVVDAIFDKALYPGHFDAMVDFPVPIQGPFLVDEDLWECSWSRGSLSANCTYTFSGYA